MCRQKDRRFLFDCIILKKLEESPQQRRVEVVLRLLKRKSELCLGLLLNLWDYEQIEQNQDYSFQTTSGTAERNQPLFVFTEIDFPVSLMYSVRTFVVEFNLNLGEMSVVR